MPLHALWNGCNSISDHPRGPQVLLGHFCVDIIDKEKKWIVRRGAFAFHLWFFSFGATEARESRENLEYSLSPRSCLAVQRFLLRPEHWLDGLFTPLVYGRSIHGIVGG